MPALTQLQHTQLSPQACGACAWPTEAAVVGAGTLTLGRRTHSQIGHSRSAFARCRALRSVFNGGGGTLAESTGACCRPSESRAPARRIAGEARLAVRSDLIAASPFSEGACGTHACTRAAHPQERGRPAAGGQSIHLQLRAGALPSRQGEGTGCCTPLDPRQAADPSFGACWRRLRRRRRSQTAQEGGAWHRTRPQQHVLHRQQHRQVRASAPCASCSVWQAAPAPHRLHTGCPALSPPCGC